jgi:perosamine synthetase
MIPHNKPTLGTQEQAAAMRVLDSGWVAQGPEVEAFENELCRFFGVPEGHALAVSSGSAGVYLALWALDGKEKHIGMPVYSCAALRNAVGLAGGKSVYLDCAENTANVDIAQVVRSNIDILIAPSMFGIPVALPSARSYKVVEDLAQSFGAAVDGNRIGLRGEVGICSFYATKMITSGGQGGAVISRDKALIDKVRDYREFDCRDDRKLRFNFQMTDIQAAIGRSQLCRLPDFIQRRTQLFSIYREAGLELIDSHSPQIKPVRYRAVIRCSEPVRVINTLAAAGVRAIIPVETYELLDTPDRYPVAQALTQTTVSLPLYPALNVEDAHRIARIAKEAT